MKKFRRDSTCLRVWPEINGRIEFYHKLLKSENRSTTLNILMDLAQERIDQFNKQEIEKQSHTTTNPIHSHCLTNDDKNEKINESISIEA